MNFLLSEQSKKIKYGLDKNLNEANEDDQNNNIKSTFDDKSPSLSMSNTDN